MESSFFKSISGMLFLLWLLIGETGSIFFSCKMLILGGGGMFIGGGGMFMGGGGMFKGFGCDRLVRFGGGGGGGGRFVAIPPFLLPAAR